MKFNIISINDDRWWYKKQIRNRIEFNEVKIPSINAYKSNIYEELDKRGLKIVYAGMFSVGEIGIWLSTFDCWKWAAENEELIVFEDDAVPSENFTSLFVKMYQELPTDYDFLSLWVPDNQRDYLYDVVYNEEGHPDHVGPNKNAITSIYNIGAMHIARVYQGYGNVAQLYSQKGGQRLVDRAQSTGIYTPVDCFLYQNAHTNFINGYAPKPNRTHIVSYDWKAETTVHREGRV